MSTRGQAKEQRYEGFPLGGRQRTGHPGGWHLVRDYEPEAGCAFPARGTVGGNLPERVHDDADGW